MGAVLSNDMREFIRKTSRNLITSMQRELFKIVCTTASNDLDLTVIDAEATVLVIVYRNGTLLKQEKLWSLRGRVSLYRLQSAGSWAMIT